MSQVKRTERGWAGHFICASRCLFRRNTLIEFKDKKWVISTVGLMHTNPNVREFEKIGLDRYYETMAFEANLTDTRYFDINVQKQISFNSPWAINIVDADDLANEMHETVVIELMETIQNG